MHSPRQISDDDVSFAVRCLDIDLNGDTDRGAGHSNNKASSWASVALLIVLIGLTLCLIFLRWLPTLVHLME